MSKYTGWKKRYSYLDDYKKGVDGQYVYYGRHYIYKGSGFSLKQYKCMLGLLDLLLAALFIAGGFQNGGVIWSTWYVVVPYAVEAVVIFLMLWKTLSVVIEKVPLKAHIYQKTVPWFRPLSFILAVIALISLLGTVLCLILRPDEIRLTGCIIYIAIKAVTACTGILFAGRINTSDWEPDPDEELTI